MSITNILNITKMTIIDIVHKRFVYVIFFVSLIFIGGSLFLNVYDASTNARILKDLALSWISFFNAVFCIMLGIGLIPPEIENKTIYPLLAKPISRLDYLSGKFLGALAVVGFNILLMALELMIIVSLKGEGFNLEFLKFAYLVFIEAGILLSFLVTFSLLVSPPLNATLSFALYVVGHISMTYVQSFAVTTENVSYNLSFFMLKIIKYILPHLSYFDIKNALVHQYSITLEYMLVTTFYGLAYIALVMIISSLIFRYKDL